MKKHIIILTLFVLAAAVAGCRSRTDRSEGTVLLSISDVSGLPSSISVRTADRFQIDRVTIRNIAKDPTGTTGDLQTVELRSYEVRFRRRDTGTRVPPPAVQAIFGAITVNGSRDVTNVAFLLSDQLLSQPLKDLRDFGVDRETGTAVIVLDVSITFFGRTLSGDDIATDPATFTVEVRP